MFNDNAIISIFLLFYLVGKIYKKQEIFPEKIIIIFY